MHMALYESGERRQYKTLVHPSLRVCPGSHTLCPEFSLTVFCQCAARHHHCVQYHCSYPLYVFVSHRTRAQVNFLTQLIWVSVVACANRDVSINCAILICT